MHLWWEQQHKPSTLIGVNISFRVDHTASESTSMSIKLAISTFKRGGAWKEGGKTLLYLLENERYGLWPSEEQGEESGGRSEESVTDRWDDRWLSDWRIRHSQHSLSQFKRNWITRETEATETEPRPVFILPVGNNADFCVSGTKMIQKCEMFGCKMFRLKIFHLTATQEH